MVGQPVVNVTVGVVSLELASGCVLITTVGAVRSTTKLAVVALAELVAASVTLIVIVCVPSTTVGVNVPPTQLTLPPTTAGAVVQLVGWFILGFAFYSTAMGVLGALASRVEEASNASMPVTMSATLAYILSIVFVTQEPAGLLARIMTFLPPAAPMVVPLRAALGEIEAWEIVVSVALMLASIWLLFAIGGRVYSGAVLQTGGQIRLRDAWRASR